MHYMHISIAVAWGMITLRPICRWQMQIFNTTDFTFWHLTGLMIAMYNKYPIFRQCVHIVPVEYHPSIWKLGMPSGFHESHRFSRDSLTEAWEACRWERYVRTCSQKNSARHLIDSTQLSCGGKVSQDATIELMQRSLRTTHLQQLNRRY